MPDICVWCGGMHHSWLCSHNTTREAQTEIYGGAEKNGTMKVKKFTVGIKFRIGSCWIGFHWSPFNKRLCLNLVPFITFWFVWPGGTPASGRTVG